MLYNRNWDAKTKVDPFSLESLIAWLEKQPADAPYCYENTGGCLFFHYFTAMGRSVAGVGGTHIRFREAPYEIIEWEDKSFKMIAAMSPHTFGAALERARVALALQQH